MYHPNRKESSDISNLRTSGQFLLVTSHLSVNCSVCLHPLQQPDHDRFWEHPSNESIVLRFRLRFLLLSLLSVPISNRKLLFQIEQEDPQRVHSAPQLHISLIQQMIRSDIGFSTVKSRHHSLHLLHTDPFLSALGVTANKIVILPYNNYAMQNELTVIAPKEYDIMVKQRPQCFSPSRPDPFCCGALAT